MFLAEPVNAMTSVSRTTHKLQCTPPLKSVWAALQSVGGVASTICMQHALRDINFLASQSAYIQSAWIKPGHFYCQSSHMTTDIRSLIYGLQGHYGSTDKPTATSYHHKNGAIFMFTTLMTDLNNSVTNLVNLVKILNDVTALPRYLRNGIRNRSINLLISSSYFGYKDYFLNQKLQKTRKLASYHAVSCPHTF